MNQRVKSMSTKAGKAGKKTQTVSAALSLLCIYLLFKMFDFKCFSFFRVAATEAREVHCVGKSITILHVKRKLALCCYSIVKARGSSLKKIGLGHNESADSPEGRWLLRKPGSCRNDESCTVYTYKTRSENSLT